MKKTKLIRNVRKGEKFIVRDALSGRVTTVVAGNAQETIPGFMTGKRQWMIPGNYPWWWGCSAVTGYSKDKIEVF
jgi:hypothetical protein